MAVVDDLAVLNADAEDVADSPVDEELDEELNDDALDYEGLDEEEDGEEDSGGPTEEADGLDWDEDAEAENGEAGETPEGGDGPDHEKAMQPAKSGQSPEADRIAAAARRDAERQLREMREVLEAERAGKEAFARKFGHTGWAEMERFEREQSLIDSGVSAPVAQELAALTAKTNALEHAANEAAEQREREQQRWNELFDAYPEVTRMDSLPAEVLEAVDRGETPLQAYRAYDVKQLRARMSAMEQNQRIKKKAPGSARGVRTGPARIDPFLAGLG